MQGVGDTCLGLANREWHMRTSRPRKVQAYLHREGGSLRRKE